MVAGILGVELALAIGKAAHEGTGAFFAKHVAIRQAVSGEDLLNHGSQPTRSFAEELVARIDDFLRRVLLGM